MLSLGIKNKNNKLYVLGFIFLAISSYSYANNILTVSNKLLTQFSYKFPEKIVDASSYLLDIILGIVIPNIFI